MKNRKKLVSLALAGFFWWALFYPDLYLVKDECLVVKCEDCERKSMSEDLFQQLCEAKPGEITIKSRLLEWFYERNEH